MKSLILLFALTSCAYSKYPLYREPVKKDKTHVDRMNECVLRLIEKNGVNAKTAQEVCEKIYRRN